VTWDEALAYCDWLRDETGKGYRLSTEAEWEWAARGRQGRRFPWGQDSPLIELANFGQGDHSPPLTKPVGANPRDRSPFGVMDMAGNVAEWCADTWNLGTHTKVIRGSSWNEMPIYLRCAARRECPATVHREDLGFRVAMDP
jgi:formylglycine-generating enzyme required for sulfatase activity